MIATLIFDERLTVQTTEGKTVLIHWDLYKLPEPYDPSYPQGFRFSWIAMDADNVNKRVLFDCHTPKGPHLHIDLEKEGTAFIWESLEATQQLFFLKITEHFGEIPALKGALK